MTLVKFKSPVGFFSEARAHTHKTFSSSSSSSVLLLVVLPAAQYLGRAGGLPVGRGGRGGGLARRERTLLLGLVGWSRLQLLLNLGRNRWGKCLKCQKKMWVFFGHASLGGRRKACRVTNHISKLLTCLHGRDAIWQPPPHPTHPTSCLTLSASAGHHCAKKGLRNLCHTKRASGIKMQEMHTIFKVEKMMMIGCACCCHHQLLFPLFLTYFYCRKDSMTSNLQRGRSIFISLSLSSLVD